MTLPAAGAPQGKEHELAGLNDSDRRVDDRVTVSVVSFKRWTWITV